MSNRWVKAIIDNKEEYITNDSRGIHFLEWEIPSVATVNNDI